MSDGQAIDPQKGEILLLAMSTPRVVCIERQPQSPS